MADLPRLAGVAVSHGHYDHYDMDAFAAYPEMAVPISASELGTPNTSSSAMRPTSSTAMRVEEIVLGIVRAPERRIA